MLLLKAYPMVPSMLWSGSSIELAIGGGNAETSCRRIISQRKSKFMFLEVYYGYRHELEDNLCGGHDPFFRLLMP